MKKKIIFFSMFMFVMQCMAKDQLFGTYQINNSDKTFSCYIEFYKNGCYNLDLENKKHGSDMIDITMLSYGKYFIKNDKVILVDYSHGFSLQLRFFMDDFVVEKGFTFMKNKIFIHQRDNYELECHTSNINITKQKQERNTYQQSHKILYPIYYGTYESPDNTSRDDKYSIYETGLGYEVQIKKENKYSVYYKRILISEGTWERNRNELSLYDDNLQHPFYVLITEKGLVSKYLPGEYRSCLLIYKVKK
jgi:hypothetical protein